MLRYGSVFSLLDLFPPVPGASSLFKKALLDLASGHNVEGRPISCCILMGPAPREEIQINNQSISFYSENNGQIVLDSEFIKLYCSTVEANHLCCRIDPNDGRLLGVSLIPRNELLKTLGGRDHVVALIEPTKSLRFYQRGQLDLQIIQFGGGSGYYVARKMDRTLSHETMGRISSSSQKTPQRVLLTTLCQASQQGHGIAIGVIFQGRTPSTIMDRIAVTISRSFDINIEVTSADQLFRLSEMDGCVLVTPTNGGFTVFKAGCYLTGPGGRHASAEYLSQQLGEDGIVAVVSQDGPISWFFNGTKLNIEDEVRYKLW